MNKDTEISAPAPVNQAIFKKHPSNLLWKPLPASEKQKGERRSLLYVPRADLELLVRQYKANNEEYFDDFTQAQIGKHFLQCILDSGFEEVYRSVEIDRATSLSATIALLQHAHAPNTAIRQVGLALELSHPSKRPTSVLEAKLQADRAFDNLPEGFRIPSFDKKATAREVAETCQGILENWKGVFFLNNLGSAPFAAKVLESNEPAT